MNNKELTELKREFESNLGKLTLLKDEMESYYTVVNPSSLWRWIESKLTQPREEIKREAVEESMLLRLSSRVHAMFRDAIDPESVSGYNEALDDVQDMIQEYLTQQSLDGGGE